MVCPTGGEGSAVGVAALRCGMSRIQATLAIVASALLMILGAYFGLTKGDTDAATLGWVFAFVGAVGLGVNLVLRSRMR